VVLVVPCVLIVVLAIPLGLRVRPASAALAGVALTLVGRLFLRAAR
jgi:hypothetical protein